METTTKQNLRTKFESKKHWEILQAVVDVIGTIDHKYIDQTVYGSIHNGRPVACIAVHALFELANVEINDDNISDNARYDALGVYPQWLNDAEYAIDYLTQGSIDQYCYYMEVLGKPFQPEWLGKYILPVLNNGNISDDVHFYNLIAITAHLKAQNV